MIVRQLGVECGDEDRAVAEQHRLAVVLGEHLDAGADVPHARGADEDAPERLVLARDREIRLEARDLPAVGVPRDLDVHQPEVRAVEEDHPGAGAEDRSSEDADRLVDAVLAPPAS